MMDFKLAIDVFFLGFLHFELWVCERVYVVINWHYINSSPINCLVQYVHVFYESVTMNDIKSFLIHNSCGTLMSSYVLCLCQISQ